SAHLGEQRFLALANGLGWETTLAAIEAVLDGAERQTRAVIAEWQDGVYFGEALLDDDGRGNEDIHIRATVTKSGSDLKIDLSDSHAEVASFINSSYPNMYSSVVVALSYLIDPHTPKNDGTFRPIEVIAKPGTVVWQAAGGIKFGSLEVTEVRFPLFFKTHEFRAGSGGAGQYRGGPGGIVEMVVETAEPAIGNTAGDGVRHGACGILGGGDG